MKKNEFRMGFFGGNPFDRESRKELKEKWMKMSDSEKLEFMNKKMENLDEDPFSIESIDARCEKWLKMTNEEKEEFINRKKEIIKDKKQRMKHFFQRMHY